MSQFRAYFYDLTTRRELKDHPLNGKTWIATGGFVRDAAGAFIRDTTTSVEIADFANMSSVRNNRVVTKADFPNPVAVKIWYGPTSPPEWRKLV